MAPLLLAVAGCGSMTYAPASSNGAFSISASATAVHTNGQVRLGATLASGAPVDVQWTVAGGQNAPALGQGRIDANGLYTPPSALSQDTIDVQLKAQLQSDSASVATANITVHPGFVQTLLPENASLSPGATLEVTGEIAEVDGGTIQWSLATSPAGSRASGANLGTLSNEYCQHKVEQYTNCRVSYTAPNFISGPTAIYLIGKVNGSASGAAVTPLKILLNTQGFNSSPTTNQAIQTGAIALGSSGGNDNDYDTYEDRNGNPYIADCCGGTLGALVEDQQKNQYILSNNHVLAESDHAMIGDTIDQPGLIDGACVPLNRGGSTIHPVGTLKYYVPLASSQTNVDAALAAVAPGAVDPSGSILQLGKTGANNMLTAAPPVAGTGEILTAANLGGMQVVKSGRTTGLTCSSIDAVHLSVKIDYYKDCAETQPYYTKTYRDQIGIAGDRFTDTGDSGALVLDASNAQPVGLYFAGGTDGNGHGLSIANPIGDVLQELGTHAGNQFSIVGSNTPHAVSCTNYDTSTSAVSAAYVSQAAMDRAKTTAETAGAALVNTESGILGVAAGKSLDASGEAALIVYTDKTRTNVSVPKTVEGIRTQVIATDALSVARGAAPDIPTTVEGIHLSANTLASATAVEQEYATHLMVDPAVFGVGVTQSEDNPSEAALLVLTDINRSPKSMPAVIDGLRVRYMRLHRFHVTRSKYAGAASPSSCSLQGMYTASHKREDSF